MKKKPGKKPTPAERHSIHPKEPLLIYSPLIADGVPEMERDSDEFNIFWGEHRRRCIEGYKPTGGVWIPGRYYYYLNVWSINRAPQPFDRIKGGKFTSFPLYRDGDHELIEVIEDSFPKDYNIIIGKRRRLGVTDLIMGSCMAYEISMFQDNQVGLGYPNDEAFANIIPHFEIGWNALPRPFYQKFEFNNDSGYKVGYVDKGDEGDESSGGQSIFFTKKFVKSGVFKGGWQKFLWFDEIGEFEDKPTLEQCYLDSQNNVNESGLKIGTLIMSGTSDKINRNNPWYEKMWYDPAKYGLHPHFMPASKMMWSFFDISTGKSDIKGAEEHIRKEYARLEESEDKTAYIKFIQNNPLTPEDMFMWGGGDNGLNIMRINERARLVREDKKLKAKILIGDLVEERGKSGELTGKVMFVPNIKGRWRIPDYGFPVNDTYPNADIIGVDDYYKEVAPESDSLGAVVVWRRLINHSVVSRCPVGIYLYRPSRREGGRDAFHKDTSLAARFWKAQVACEYNDEGLKNWYIANGLRKYLKMNIKSLGTVAREVDGYGFSMKEHEIITADNKIIDWVDSEYFNNVYDLLLMQQLTDIGKKNVDVISALRVCMMFEDYLMATPVISPEAASPNIGVDNMLNRFTRNEQGKIVVLKNGSNASQLFGWQKKKYALR